MIPHRPLEQTFEVQTLPMNDLQMCVLPLSTRRAFTRSAFTGSIAPSETMRAGRSRGPVFLGPSLTAGQQRRANSRLTATSCTLSHLSLGWLPSDSTAVVATSPLTTTSTSPLPTGRPPERLHLTIQNRAVQSQSKREKWPIPRNSRTQTCPSTHPRRTSTWSSTTKSTTPRASSTSTRTFVLQSFHAFPLSAEQKGRLGDTRLQPNGESESHANITILNLTEAVRKCYSTSAAKTPPRPSRTSGTATRRARSSTAC